MLMLGVSEIELGEPWIAEMYVASTMWHHFARYLPVNQQHTCSNEFSNSTIQVDILIRFKHKYLCCFPKRWLPSGCYNKAATHVQSLSSGLPVTCFGCVTHLVAQFLMLTNKALIISHIHYKTIQHLGVILPGTNQTIFFGLFQTQSQV